MRIFHNDTVDRLAKRLIPGVAVAGLAAWGIAYGGPELENVPGLIPRAEAVELENGESTSSGSAAGTLAALNAASQGGTSSDPFTDGTYKDGTYTGTARGFGGNITVKVTISGGQIKAIDVVSAKDETPSYFERAKAVIAQVIAKQTPNVDTVSGATYSSNGILNAVRRALTQASGQPEEPEQPDTPEQPEEPTTPQEPDENTETEDMVYSAEVSCVPDEFGDFDAYDRTVAVTVRQTTNTETQTATDADGNTKTVTKKTVTRALSNIAVTRPDAASGNWGYITWALDGRGSAAGIKAQAIEKQSFGGLDVVSRATCSSKSIVEAGKMLDLALGTTVTEEEQ